MAELAGEFDNVTFHIGDSAELLPQVLAELGREAATSTSRSSTPRTRATRCAATAPRCSAADACRQTVIVFHDSANAEVRAGLEDLELAEHPKVALALLDCVPGYLVQAHADDSLIGQAFNGLALVVLDADRDPHARGYDAPEFVPIPALHEAYAAAHQPPRATSRQGRRGGLGRRRQRRRGRRRGRA